MMEQTTQVQRYPRRSTIHREVLSNGITIVVYENFAVEAVVVEGVVRAGALLEPAEKAGLAGFVANTLLHGTQQRRYHQIYDALESVGAELLFSSGYHGTTFSAQSLVEDFELVLDLLAQSLRAPTFPAAQVEQVRGQLLTGLQLRARDTAQMAMLSFREVLYEGHPYGRSYQGTIDSVRAITAEDLATFHTRRYGPQGMIVTVVGAVPAAQAVAAVAQVLGDWTVPAQQPTMTVPDVGPPDLQRRTAVVLPQKSQADVVLGWPGPRRSASDYLDASMANTVLGVFGMMGRIGQRVREAEGLAYYAYSRLQGGLGPAPWVAAAGVAPEHVERAINLMLAEIKRLQDEPVPDDELADCQAFRIGSLPVSLETNSGLADVITDMMLYELGLDYLITFPDLIRDITPDRVQAAAQKYLSTEQLAIAVAGPGRE